MTNVLANVLANAAGVVGAYGAIVATIALGWQVYSWRHVRRTRVEVRLETNMTEFDTSWVEVVNRSEHPIYVRQVELAPRSEDRPTVLQLDEPFPIQIEAYSSRGFPCDVVDEELGRMGVHPGAGFVPRVVLADGRIFQSISRRSLDQDERKGIRVKVRDALRRASRADSDVDKR